MNDTKSRIVDAAIVLFAEYGYTETSMRSIAEAVQVKPSSIYNHFRSKSEILDTIFAEYSTYILEHAIKGDELAQLDGKTALRRILHIFESDVRDRMTNILKIIMHEQFRVPTARQFMGDDMLHGNYHYARGVMEELVELGKIPAVNVDMYARLFMAILITASLEVMHFPFYGNRYMKWDLEHDDGKGDIATFLIDQIVDG